MNIINAIKVIKCKVIYHWVYVLTLRELIARPSSSLTVSQTTTLKMETGEGRQERRGETGERKTDR